MSGKEPWCSDTMQKPSSISEEEKELRYAVAFGKKTPQELEAYLAAKEGKEAPEIKE